METLCCLVFHKIYTSNFKAISSTDSLNLISLSIGISRERSTNDFSFFFGDSFTISNQIQYALIYSTLCIFNSRTLQISYLRNKLFNLPFFSLIDPEHWLFLFFSVGDNFFNRQYDDIA